MTKTEYEILLFDADRTLFDFDRGEENALSVLMASIGHPLTPEAFALYREINSRLWAEFERGERNNASIAPTRFHLFFSHLDIALDADRAAENYLALLGEQRFLLPGAYELIEKLFGRFDMYLATNGIASVQKNRFAKSELAPFFKGIFISGELGAAKPDPEYYRRALEKIGSPDRRRILAIGDSPGADIRGANSAGIDACYYNPGKKPMPQGIWAKYTVADLGQIREILL